MNKKIKGRSISEKAGLPPGSLVHIGKKREGQVLLELISYNGTEYNEYADSDISKLYSHVKPENVDWFNIEGLHDINLIRELGEKFELHPLLLEDVLNTEHRPGAEDYDDHLFFTLKMLNSIDGDEITYEQVSFVVGKDYVLSFQEKRGDIFDSLRERIKQDGSKLRKRNADYLFYRLIDTIVDSYYIVLEKIGERIETLEEEVLMDPDEKNLKHIQNLKKELIFLRKTVYPLREAISRINKDETGIIAQETTRYLMDVYEHTVFVIESVETYRDLINGLTDLYMTGVSNRMNNIMKVLTIIATIFIPLTFIAGVYGMNFQHMPELEWRWAYPIVWLLMILVTGVMLLYFRKKKWL